jgi:hypothetical protein
MTTPVCIVCGAKFPGDPCKKCNAPAGLGEEDVQSYKLMLVLDKKEALKEQGMSKTQVKAAMHLRRGSKTKRRRAHGKPRG